MIHGGGQGMLLRPANFWYFDKLTSQNLALSSLDPAGRTFDQAHAGELAQEEELVLFVVTMRGISMSASKPSDRRLPGDFVFVRGELPAMTIVDATVRLIWSFR